jgi:hypothetical protein
MRYTARTHTWTLLLLLLISLPVASSQQPDSLKERARQKGGKTSLNVHVDSAYTPLSSVVSRADVIVRARIQHKESKLTKDDRFVNTYFTFNPTRVFKDDVGILPTRRTPQMTIPLVFIEPGGVVHVEGLQITQATNVSADPPIQVGEDVLLFLKRDIEQNAFLLQDGEFGLLRIRGRLVAEMNKKMKPRLSGRSLSDIEGEIERLVKGVL